MSDSSTQAGDNHNTIIPTTKKIDIIGSNSKGEMIVVYKECLKNHAASLGSHSTDGCGEYMPSHGDDCNDLLCSACGCHRNFHRKEVDAGGNIHTYLPNRHYECNTSDTVLKNKVQECHQDKSTTTLMVRHEPHSSPNLNVGPVTTPSENNREQIKVVEMKMSKKRHRTRFTNEQKEKMLGFAQKTNWKIQRVEEGLVQQFCQEVGIKKRVLKIWMHNNKYLFAKKSTNSTLNDHDASDSSNKFNE